MPENPKLVEMRRLIARFEPPVKKAGGIVATGIASVDDLLEGGLHQREITEIVSRGPSAGTDTWFASLLKETRIARQRVALIDAAKVFSPQDQVHDHLRHLVWVGCTKVSDAISVTDILVRDCNYGVVTLDLREVSAKDLSRIPATTWHRLRIASEDAQAAFVVLTNNPLVPAVAWRLELTGQLRLGRLPISEVKNDIEAHSMRVREREKAWRISA